MNKINRKVEYALMALKYMMNKTPGELTAVKELRDHLGMPFDPTAKVLQSLTQWGVLKSEQGAQGGYLIIKNLKKVSFYELTEAVVGPVEVTKCLKSSGPCELIETCNIQSPLSALNDKLVEFYKSLSVYEILQPAKPGLTSQNLNELAKSAENWL